MELRELFDFIGKQNEILDRRYYEDFSERERTLERVLKVNEEFGELCDEILRRFGSQRREKVENDITHEVADVLICVLLLADSLGVDVERALEEKIGKVKGRFREEWEDEEDENLSAGDAD